MRRLLAAIVLGLAACSAPPPAATPPPPPAPCPAPPAAVPASESVRIAEAQRLVGDLVSRIRLSPEDEALRHPRSIQDIKTILQRDTVYLFVDAATYARSLGTLEGRFSEAYLELAIGEDQLLASQVLTTQGAWVATDLRIARASVASDAKESVPDDRARTLAQLVRAVEEGNAVADALGLLAPTHLRRAGEAIRGLRAEAPGDARIALLSAELARLRGDWADFDRGMPVAEAAAGAALPRPGNGADAPRAGRGGGPLCYLRAMEQLERYRKADVAAEQLAACTKRFPTFVRAQAAVVMLAASPYAARAALTRLRQMNEDHYLVMLLEPALAAEQELARLENHAP